MCTRTHAQWDIAADIVAGHLPFKMVRQNLDVELTLRNSQSKGKADVHNNLN